jgi:acyl-CoA dehydrogenase
LPSRLVIDHRSRPATHRLAENSARRTITDHLLGERSVGMAEVGELVLAA